jgi:microcystin-dependent protein
MSDPFLGQITMFAGNFAPRNWAFCSGQLLPISSNSALFSILGTTYGGDGRTTFALPDLRGRFPRGSEGNSSGPGLPSVRLGEKSGAQTIQLSVDQMPNHNHTGKIKASGDAANTNNPNANELALAEAYSDQDISASNIFTKPGTVVTDATGGSQSFNNNPPYLGINFIIALVGVFPSRS